MNSLQTMCLLCCFLVPSFTRGEVPAPDFFLGSWTLEPKSSHYPGNSCPKQMSIEMTREARGIHYHSKTLSSTGDTFEVDYIANYDGKPAMVMGSKGILLPVSLERKGNTVNATYRSAFQVMATSERVLSADNNTMTITTVSHDSIGTAVTNIGVYRRALSSSSDLATLKSLSSR